MFLNHVWFLHFFVLPQEGSTALMLGCWNGHIDVVEALINSKADVNLSDQVCEKLDFVIWLCCVYMTMIDMYTTCM